MVSKMADNVEGELSEDLDYHITFPSPIPEDASEEETLEYYSQASSRKEPVVILLGWMGCKEKHLAKYTAIYEQKQCITISYTLSAEKIFLGRELVRPVAVKILEMIEDLSLDENAIIFHVMSNGGSILYRSICEVLRADPQFSNLQIRGTIFDSTPGKRRARNAIKAVSASIDRHPIIKFFMLFFFTIFIFSKAFLVEVGRFLGLLSEDDSLFNALVNDPSEWPQLFLYSMADKVINYKDVDEIIAKRRKQGHLVLSLCWEDSEHVAHMRTHRETYIKQCYDFLDICTAVDDTESM